MLTAARGGGEGVGSRVAKPLFFSAGEERKGKRGGQNIGGVFEVTPRLAERHLRVGRSPTIKLASNLLGLHVGPLGSTWSDRLFVWDCI